MKDLCLRRMKKMTTKTIIEKSGCKLIVAESLYWHSLWLRKVPDDYKVNWKRLLNDKKYREHWPSDRRDVNETE